MKILPILAAVLLCVCGTRVRKVGMPPSLRTGPDRLLYKLTQRISQNNVLPLDLHEHKNIKLEYYPLSFSGTVILTQEMSNRTRHDVVTPSSTPAPVDSTSDNWRDWNTWTSTSTEPVSEQTDPCDRNCTKSELNAVCASNDHCLHIFANPCEMDAFNCRHPEGRFFALDDDKSCAVPRKLCDELLG